MGILGSLFNWAKAIVLWLLVKENREIGLRYTKKALDIVEVVAKITGTTKDDKAVAYIAKKFDEAVKLNGATNQQDIEKVASSVTSIAKGSLKDVAIGLDSGKVKATVGGVGVEYDPSNGGVKFGFSGRF